MEGRLTDEPKIEIAGYLVCERGLNARFRYALYDGATLPYSYTEYERIYPNRRIKKPLEAWQINLGLEALIKLYRAEMEAKLVA